MKLVTAQCNVKPQTTSSCYPTCRLKQNPIQSFTSERESWDVAWDLPSFRLHSDLQIEGVPLYGVLVASILPRTNSLQKVRPPPFSKIKMVKRVACRSERLPVLHTPVDSVIEDWALPPPFPSPQNTKSKEALAAILDSHSFFLTNLLIKAMCYPFKITILG